MKASIHIDTRTFVRFWLVILGIGLAILAITMASSALMILGVSLFLAIALSRPVTLISKKLPGKSRAGAVAIAYVAVIAVLSAILFLVIPPIIQQTAELIQKVPQFITSLTQSWEGLRLFIEQYNLQPQIDSAVQSVQQAASGWAGDFTANIISSIGSVFAFLAAAILVLVLTFLMLVEGPSWMERVWGVYNNEARMQHHKSIVERIYRVFTGYVTGQLTVSSIGALAAGLTVFIIGVISPDVPTSLAMPTVAITFVLSLIPMFGATIGGVIITALLAFNNIPAAIIYAAYFVVYQQVENNFISPHIQSKKIDLSPLAVLAAVTIGLYMFGVIGGIIAIPIAGAIRILVEEYLEHARTQREKSKKLAKKSN